MKTFGSVLDENGGVGRGFDSLRVILAFSVIAWHCFPLTAGSSEPGKATVLWTTIYSLVPMFFALSGFLVTGSALRLPIGKFAISRALRIVPALAVDTFVTILLIGPALTVLPLQDFWTRPATAAYLLNIVGEIHYALPGVFDQNPVHAVNGSLWTIRPELGCYAMIGMMIATRWISDWRKVAVGAVGFFLLMVAVKMTPSAHVLRGIGWFNTPGAKLVPLFLVGSLGYLLRYKIPHSPYLFLFALTIIIGSGLILPSKEWWESPSWILVTAPLLAYMVIFVGLLRLPRLPLFSRGDYSYGIYLYGFPIQQAMISLTGTRDPLTVFALTFAPVTAVAMMSWHFVEKPTLKLRKGFSFAAKLEAERREAADLPANEMRDPRAT